ncbi:MAG TPA: methyl-accepting chemotaxis protein, partial [Pseudohaliea sp.]|nr:methyl-accepting chemotaxis protein [Pseudohaliea sp.]
FGKLEAVQQSKRSQVERFFAARSADVSVLAGNGTVQAALQEFTQAFRAGSDDVGGARWQAAAERFSPWLADYRERYGYYDLFLISAAGDVVYTVAGESDLGANLVTGPLASSGLGRVYAKGREQPAIKDFAPYAPSNGDQASFIAAPVVQGGELLGVVALQVPLAPIHDIVQSREGLGRTGETYLVGRTAGVSSFRSDMLTMGDGRYVVGHPISTPYSEKALEGETVRHVYTDSNGQLVLVKADPLDLPGLQWGIVTKIDLKEVLTSDAWAEGDLFSRFTEHYGYYDLFLIHPQGEIFYSVAQEADYGTNLVHGEYSDSGLGRLFRRVRETGKFGFRDFQPYAPSNGAPAGFIAQPVVVDGTVEMVVALQLPLEQINAIMQRREGMGSTGETYLVGPDKRMRSDSFLDPQAHSVAASFAGTVEANGVDSEASRAALAGETGESIITDYNGNPVLSAFTPVTFDTTTWALLAEVDEAEAFGAVNRLETLMAVVMGGAAIAVLFMALWVGRSIANPVGQALQVARTIASGDLTSRFEVTRRDEIGEMLEAMQNMNDRLRELVRGVRQDSDAVSTASSEIATGSADLSQRTEEQASSLEETASSMEEMTATVKQNADNAALADRLASEAKAHADSGSEVISRTVTAMGEISESSRRIEKIISVIDELAFQTNLLALNAAVEAARAGEQGRGFAVVAGEVRKLAQRSAESAGDIKSLINESVGKAQEGSRYVEESGLVLEKILSSTGKVSDLISEIAQASLQQSSGIEQVNKAVMQMDELTQQNAALVEQTAASASALNDQSGNLRERMRVFKVGDDENPAG